MKPVIIVGVGLSGLTAAYLLTKRRVPALVLEARSRVGGRTFTVTSHEAPFDLDATWVWPHHRFISELVEELGLVTFPQFECDGVRVQLIDGRSCEGSAVVIAPPPRVAERSVTFEPALPDALQSAQRATPTWMGGSAKAVVVFERPFWRDEGLPGFAVSYRGPLGELHDVGPDGARVGAIEGFFASSQSSGEPG